MKSKTLNRHLLLGGIYTSIVGVVSFYLPVVIGMTINPFYNQWAKSQSSCSAGMAGLWCSLPFALLLTVLVPILRLGLIFTVYIFLTKWAKSKNAFFITLAWVIITSFVSSLSPTKLSGVPSPIIIYPALFVVIYVLIEGREKK